MSAWVLVYQGPITHLTDTLWLVILISKLFHSFFCKTKKSLFWVLLKPQKISFRVLLKPIDHFGIESCIQIEPHTSEFFLFKIGKKVFVWTISTLFGQKSSNFLRKKTFGHEPNLLRGLKSKGRLKTYKKTWIRPFDIRSFVNAPWQRKIHTTAT